jgi:hypothetical protein
MADTCIGLSFVLALCCIINQYYSSNGHGIAYSIGFLTNLLYHFAQSSSRFLFDLEVSIIRAISPKELIAILEEDKEVGEKQRK